MARILWDLEGATYGDSTVHLSSFSGAVLLPRVLYTKHYATHLHGRIQEQRRHDSNQYIFLEDTVKPPYKWHAQDLWRITYGFTFMYKRYHSNYDGSGKFVPLIESCHLWECQLWRFYWTALSNCKIWIVALWVLNQSLGLRDCLIKLAIPGIALPHGDCISHRDYRNHYKWHGPLNPTQKIIQFVHDIW